MQRVLSPYTRSVELITVSLQARDKAAVQAILCFRVGFQLVLAVITDM
jgi:hypothetical protein